MFLVRLRVSLQTCEGHVCVRVYVYVDVCVCVLTCVRVLSLHFRGLSVRPWLAGVTVLVKGALLFQVRLVSQRKRDFLTLERET